jgi:phosphoglycerate dehydrogenase-like enzyme
MLRRPTRNALLFHLADTEILISERSDQIDKTLIDAAPHLRLIQRLGSMTYDIDIAAATARGIPVCALPNQGCIMVAEHLMMQMLTLVKRQLIVSQIAVGADAWGRPSRRTDENTFAYNWSKQSGIDGIYGQTVGILGFGEIGVELARRLQPFQPGQLLYHKRRRLPDAVEACLGLCYAEPAQVIAHSNFLCSLLPFSVETELSLNAETFSAMPQSAFLVSCGSGSVIDETALAAALRAGHLAGVALDTFEYEPLRADNPLVQLAQQPNMNILLTPHTAAGASSKPTTVSRQSEYVNILNFLQGKPLLHRVSERL